MYINNINDIDSDWKVYFLMRKWEVKHGESFLDYYEGYISKAEPFLLEQGLLSRELYSKMSDILDCTISELYELQMEVAGTDADMKVATLICKAIVTDKELLESFYKIVIDEYGLYEIDDLEEVENNETFKWLDFSSEYYYFTKHDLEDLL